MVTANRYHDISCGHRVFGHESKCKHFHGHNYRVHFSIAAKNNALDNIGRVIDFSVIKNIFCEWLENNWDHKFLLWNEDAAANIMLNTDPDGVVLLNFNPTAENLAGYLLLISDDLLQNTNCKLVSVTIEETRKCSVTITI